MNQPILEPLPDILRRISLSRSSVYKAIKDGTFPKQVRVGARRIAFLKSEVDEWIANRVAVSRAGEGRLQ